MKSYFLTLLFICSTLILFAQQPFQHRCGYDHAVQQRDAAYPGYQAQADALFEEARRLALAQGGNRTTYTIPLAVHVVWKNPAENLPECKIIEQVAILNENYQRLNADTANLRAIFANVAANPNIQFRLDTIIWTQTTTNFFSGGFLPDISISDKVKHDSTGGSDALNPTGYLNIWVCNLGTAGMLGYAYPPAGLSNWPANSEAPTLGDEGVVLDYRIVGKEGAYVAQTTTINTEGNAAIHEVGHYLGLRHIWGDGLLSILGIPDCNADDGLTDTPNAGIPSNYACNPAQNTCGAGTTGDLPDMIENYMDYSEETCQNTFTQGQVGIMHSVLNLERSGLANTPPMNNIVRQANDAQPFAEALQVNTDETCTLSTSTQNLNASQSMSACGGGVANDIWYSFEAPSSGLIVNVSNVSATVGSNTTVVYELFSGTCGSLQSLGCYNQATDTIAGLTPNEIYYTRFYSDNASASLYFNICLQSYGVATALKPVNMESSVNVYPNPSTGIIQVLLPSNVDYQGTLEIKNLLGQRLGNTLHLDHNAGQVEVNLSNLPNGVYLLDFNMGTQRFSKKVMLQR